VILACGDGPADPTPAPDVLEFVVQPGAADGSVPISPAPRVEVRRPDGTPLSGATQEVTITLGASSSGGSLSGTSTVRAVGGVATFSDLRIDLPGGAYTFIATADGLQPAVSAPFAVTLTFTTVSAGYWTTCGLTTGGWAYCWGHNEFGAVGTGSASDIVDRPLAVVSGGVPYASIDVGTEFTCALDFQSRAQCWGWNATGQLGDGSTDSRGTPADVTGGLELASVVAGGRHACGRTASGAAYCWGGNVRGALGDGSHDASYTPVPVVGGVSFADVTAGREHTCGLTASGEAHCWGRLVHPDPSAGPWIEYTTPEPVSGEHSFTVIDAGRSHTCGIAAEDGGILHCWGTNERDELGDGTGVSRADPVPVGGALRFAAVAAGNRHTCAIAIDGRAYCWGENFYGQLGDGSVVDQPTPVAVATSKTFTAIVAGTNHTCALATDGLYCWGLNVDGELGTSSPDRLVMVPTRVRH
jgi:alpha-tubulin suppressor-like RCC1 family protein